MKKLKNLHSLFILLSSTLFIVQLSTSCDKNYDKSNFQDYIYETKFKNEDNIILMQTLGCRTCVSHKIDYINSHFNPKNTLIVLNSFDIDIIDSLNNNFKFIIEREGYFAKKGINFKYDIHVELNNEGKIINQQWLN